MTEVSLFDGSPYYTGMLLHVSPCSLSPIKCMRIRSVRSMLLPHTTLLYLQMYSMRETHAEMSTLLNQDEATALGLPQAFVPFAQLHPLHVSEYTTAAWQSAQEEYDRRMAPVENHISQKLKELFGE